MSRWQSNEGRGQKSKKTARRGRGATGGGNRSRSKSGKKISQSSAAWLERQSKDQYAKRARDERSPSRAIYKLEHIDKSLRGNGRSRSGLFRKGDVVVDLGASPGGWCLYASKEIGPTGKLVAVDLLPLDRPTMTSLERDENAADFYFAQGDFNSLAVKEYIVDALRHEGEDFGDDGTINQVETLLQYRADVVMSDLAPNFTGDQRTDALRTMLLCEHALMFAAGSTCFTAGADREIEDAAGRMPNISWQDIGLLHLGGSFLCKFFQCGKENERELIGTTKGLFAEAKVIKPPASRKQSAEQYLLATGYQGTPLLRYLVDKYRL